MAVPPVRLEAVTRGRTMGTLAAHPVMGSTNALHNPRGSGGAGMGGGGGGGGGREVRTSLPKTHTSAALRHAVDMWGSRATHTLGSATGAAAVAAAAAASSGMWGSHHGGVAATAVARNGPAASPDLVSPVAHRSRGRRADGGGGPEVNAAPAFRAMPIPTSTGASAGSAAALASFYHTPAVTGGAGGATPGGKGPGATGKDFLHALLTGEEVEGGKVVVDRKEAAAKLSEAEERLNASLQAATAIRVESGTPGGSSVGTPVVTPEGGAGGAKTGLVRPKRGSVQVARSLARRRQARLEIAQLSSKNAFVDRFWYGNTPKAGPLTDGTGAGAATGTKTPGSGPATGPAGGAGAMGGKRFTFNGTTRGHPGATDDPDRPREWTKAGGDGRVVLAPGAPGAASTGVDDVADEEVDVEESGEELPGGGGRRRRVSMGHDRVEEILAQYDRDRSGAKRKARSLAVMTTGGAAVGAGGGAAAAAGGGGVRGGTRVTPLGGIAYEVGDDDPSAGGGLRADGDPTAAKQTIFKQLAEQRRADPEDGCAGCVAKTFRCCRECWVAYNARRGAAGATIVLTGRAQEAAEALGLSYTQLKQLHRCFVDMDVGLEGKVHIQDFFEEFIQMPRTAVTDAIYSALVDNTVGEMIGFDDFALIVMIYCMFTEEDVLRFCFSVFDANGNGELDEQEFIQLTRIVNHDKPLFPGNFRTALEEFDTNRDGVISFEEFVMLNKKYPQILWPLFQLQDRMQDQTLGRDEWTRLAEKVANLRRTKDDPTRIGVAGAAKDRGL